MLYERKSTVFEEKVYRALKKVPPGKVTSYRDLAEFVGLPRAARAVGNALHRNPDAPTVACHRVVCSDGYLGGYAGGLEAKIKLLAAEGVFVKDKKIINFSSVRFKFD
jgi:O-6-methylguanine DNA methyltransferase